MLTSLIKNCTTKPFPAFIRDSYIIRDNKIEISKVFPKIGLINSKENIDVNFNFTDIRLDKVVHLAIKRYIADFQENYFLADLKGMELFKMSNIMYIFQELNGRFNKKYGIEYVNGKVKLTNSIPSYDGKTLIKAGTDCFKLVKSLFVIGAKYSKVDLISSEEIAAQCKNLKIAFSSDGIDGAWDIATMSMRGVKSCMRWESRQAPALVGSITDPCCGIVYLTNGSKTQYGSKMLFRALVRLMMNTNSGHPALLIDRVYSSFYKNRADESTELDAQVSELFAKYIKSKVPDITVLESVKDRHLLARYELPMPNSQNLLTENQRSYKDTPIDYSVSYFSDFESQIYKAYGIKDKAVPNKKTKSKKTLSL